MSNIKKMINMAKTDNAVEFESLFKKELGQRITSTLDDNKIEIAKNLFVQGEESDEEV